jgi:hypothetical protein
MVNYTRTHTILLTISPSSKNMKKKEETPNSRDPVLVVLRGYWNLPIVSQHCVTAVRFIQPDPYAARGLEDGLEKHGERKENK